MVIQVEIGERAFRGKDYKLISIVVWVNEHHLDKNFLVSLIVNKEHEVRTHFYLQTGWHKADVSIRVVLYERNEFLVLLKVKHIGVMVRFFVFLSVLKDNSMETDVVS